MFIEDMSPDEIAASEAEEAELAKKIADLRLRRGAGRIYPSWRYHREKDPKVVHSPEEDRRLGDEWRDVPYEGNEPPAAPQVGPNPKKAVLSTEEERLHTELHQASIAQIKAAVADLDDVEELQRMRARERRNPKNTGGRKGVLEAIDARLAALAAD